MSLKTTFCGREIRSPFGGAALAMSSPAAASAESYIDKLSKFVEYGAGIASTLYVCPEHLKDYPKGKEPTFKWGRNKREDHNYLIFQADKDCIMGRLEEGLEIVRRLRERCPENVLVQANIVVESDEPKTWAEHAKAFEDAGADIIELDVSCAINAYEESDQVDSWMRGMPLDFLADRPEELSKVLRAITSVVKIPVGFKMTPESGFPRFLYIAKAAYEAGARFVSCSNAPICVNPIDIYNRGRPASEAYPIAKNQFVGLVGGGRFIGRKQVAGIKLLVPELEVVGITGILKPEDVVDYIMLGAQITELSSGLMWYGGRYIKRVKRFLEQFMKEQGYGSIDDFRGLALKDFAADATKIDYAFGQRLAVTDESKCTGCGFCVDSQCYASYLEDGIAMVDSDECTGCGLCVHICPYEARTLVTREKPRPVGIKYPDA